MRCIVDRSRLRRKMGRTVVVVVVGEDSGEDPVAPDKELAGDITV